MHIYEVRPRPDHRGVTLISDALPFGRLWYAGPNATENAIDGAKHRSCSHDAVIRVYDAAGNAIETHENKGGKDFRFQDIDLNDTLEVTKQLSTLCAQWLKK